MDRIDIDIKRDVGFGMQQRGSFSLSASALLTDGNKTRAEALLTFEAFLIRVAQNPRDAFPSQPITPRHRVGCPATDVQASEPRPCDCGFNERKNK